MIVHREIPGSHERLGGAECRCGDEWSVWEDMCIVQHMAAYPERYPAPTAEEDTNGRV